MRPDSREVRRWLRYEVPLARRLSTRASTGPRDLPALTRIKEYARSLIHGGSDAHLNHVHHVALTVRDRTVSANWYEHVLGFSFA